MAQICLGCHVRARTSTRPPTLPEIVDHLNALTTTDSLPLALAHTILNDDAWQGLGLLSGSLLEI